MLKVDAYRVLRYLPVGMVGGLLDTVTVAMVLYAYGRSGAIWAALAGLVIGYPISFFGHRHFTFGVGMTTLQRQASTFALLKLPNISLRLLAAIAVLHERDWGVLVLLLVPVWSFMMKRWIFTGRAPWQKAAV